ncbi:T6SS effector BTH_I2691 family protein, partial [Pseudomonas guariconensis]|uniref:T6SS effector BTH_I2691 family protein n=2 Tax=Pseudomonas TaxID=286 RepID=UPI001A11194F|nr:hypothetical protein [Pseudomonas guariconensis]
VFQPPREAGKPLAKACRTQDHDVIASFININTLLYSTAWLAFANDPWPREVLNRYRQGIATNAAELAGRFVQLDLQAAREDPASVGIAMTGDDLGLDQVLEYAEYYPGRFRSTHGYYPRLDRLVATRAHVRSIIQKEQLPNGVLALTLPDPVGLVQESNAQRLAQFQAMQEWRAEPQRRFEHFTSQALLGIRQLHDSWAAEQATEEVEKEAQHTERWNNSPIGQKAYLPPVDIAAQTQRRIATKQEQARKRLEERYDEPARAAFDSAYRSELQHWQALIDQLG